MGERPEYVYVRSLDGTHHHVSAKHLPRYRPSLMDLLGWLGVED